MRVTTFVVSFARPEDSDMGEGNTILDKLAETIASADWHNEGLSDFSIDVMYETFREPRQDAEVPDEKLDEWYDRAERETRQWCDDMKGMLRHALATSAILRDSSNTAVPARSEEGQMCTCGHVRLVHLRGCHACGCKAFVLKED
jgi:hypothetical protein